MPTLDDLRNAFADLERRAPAPQPLRRPDHRARLAVALTSAAVVAVATGALLVGRAEHGGSSGNGVMPAGPQAAQHSLVRKPVVKKGATASTHRSAPASASGPSPVQISGLAGLHVVELDSHLRAGSLTVEDSNGVRWDFGWGITELNPADKPDTGAVTFEGQNYTVYPNRAGGGLFGVGVSGPGFGMTITAVGHNYTFAQYQPFLSHVAFADTLGDRSSWFNSAVS